MSSTSFPFTPDITPADASAPTFDPSLHIRILHPTGSSGNSHPNFSPEEERKMRTISYADLMRMLSLVNALADPSALVCPELPVALETAADLLARGQTRTAREAYTDDFLDNLSSNLDDNFWPIDGTKGTPKPVAGETCAQPLDPAFRPHPGLLRPVFVPDFDTFVSGSPMNELLFRSRGLCSSSFQSPRFTPTQLGLLYHHFRTLMLETLPHATVFTDLIHYFCRFLRAVAARERARSSRGGGSGGGGVDGAENGQEKSARETEVAAIATRISHIGCVISFYASNVLQERYRERFWTETVKLWAQAGLPTGASKLRTSHEYLGPDPVSGYPYCETSPFSYLGAAIWASPYREIIGYLEHLPESVAAGARNVVQLCDLLVKLAGIECVQTGLGLATPGTGDADGIATPPWQLERPRPDPGAEIEAGDEGESLSGNDVVLDNSALASAAVFEHALNTLFKRMGYDALVQFLPSRWAGRADEDGESGGTEGGDESD